MAAIAPDAMSSHSEAQKYEKTGDRNPHTFLPLIFQRRKSLLKAAWEFAWGQRAGAMVEWRFKCDSGLSNRNIMQATYAV